MNRIRNASKRAVKASNSLSEATTSVRRKDLVSGASPDPAYPGARIEPPPGFFRARGPRVVVLVHGATERPDRNPLVGHLDYARYYWGFAFVRWLLGRTDGDLGTFSGEVLTPGNWPEGACDVPTGKRLPTFAVRGDRMSDHFIAPAITDRQRTALLTHRDGSRSLADQAADAVNQIFELYNAAFGEETQPQIILIGHSMGGLVARYLLSNAVPAASNPTLSARADFIRNRTLHLTALCTPHEGSGFADLGRGIAQLLQQNGPFLQGFFEATSLPSLRETIISQCTPANDPATQNLTRSFMRTMNQTALSPERARRTDGSLIPVYVLGARDPESCQVPGRHQSGHRGLGLQPGTTCGHAGLRPEPIRCQVLSPAGELASEPERERPRCET